MAKKAGPIAAVVIIVVIALAALYYFYYAPGKGILVEKSSWVEPGENEASVVVVLGNTDSKATAKITRIEYVIFTRGVYAERGHYTEEITIAPGSEGTVTIKVPWKKEYTEWMKTENAEVRLTFIYTYDGKSASLKIAVKTLKG